MEEKVVLTSQIRDNQGLRQVRQDPGERDVLINHPRGRGEEGAERKASPHSLLQSQGLYEPQIVRKWKSQLLPYSLCTPVALANSGHPQLLSLSKWNVLLRPLACVHLFLLPGMSTTSLLGKTFYDPAPNYPLRSLPAPHLPDRAWFFVSTVLSSCHQHRTYQRLWGGCGLFLWFECEPLVGWDFVPPGLPKGLTRSNCSGPWGPVQPQVHGAGPVSGRPVAPLWKLLF